MNDFILQLSLNIAPLRSQNEAGRKATMAEFALSQNSSSSDSFNDAIEVALIARYTQPSHVVCRNDTTANA